MDVPIAGLGGLTRCISFTASQDDEGYTIVEHEDRFRRERNAEGVLRIVGVLAILAGIAQWFLPGYLPGGETVFARSVLTAAFIGTGLALYVFASRGFRRALRIDVAKRGIGIARLNASGRWLVRREVPMARIESIVVRRPTPKVPQADLCARIKGRSENLTLMRGEPDEIEALHRRLCLDIRLTLKTASVRPARVKRRALRALPLFHRKRRPSSAA